MLGNLKTNGSESQSEFMQATPKGDFIFQYLSWKGSGLNWEPYAVIRT